ncbi:MAG: lysine--tRNA ligase [Thermoproteota archaeon]|nr:MAG: lysine--tRNA ligase [Candidatus Korarchaeota archaeon]
MPPQFWVDAISKAVLEREKELDRGLKVLRVECGIGASGFPHIGSVGDAIRAFGVKLGLDALGTKSELIAYSDDRDGLRKIPVGVPSDYERYLGMPVTDIPDPWKCHSSYGEHMSQLLLEALEMLELEFTFISATQAYKSGLLDKSIDILLRNHEKVDQIIREEVGSSKPLGWIHYWPVCERCGRIYTTRVTKVLPEEGKVLYVCDQEFKGIKGCGYNGEASYRRGTGKLAWMGGEFAARWAALGISFEPHGKDITDSFRVNARICKEILKFDPPLTIVYEMFLDRTGSKISKSKGNVITPQQWLRYSPPEVLRMLMFKRYKGTRAISLEMIPTYINELEEKLAEYHNLDRIKDPRRRINIKRLVEYSYLLEKVPEPKEYRFGTIMNVISLLPFKQMDEQSLLRLVSEIIGKYYEIPQEKLREDSWFIQLHRCALNYLNEIVPYIHVETPKIDPKTLETIEKFLDSIEDDMNPEEIQSLAFSLARENQVPIRKFFSAVYFFLLGRSSGPKLGPLIRRLGIETSKSLILSAIERIRRGNGERS